MQRDFFGRPAERAARVRVSKSPRIAATGLRAIDLLGWSQSAAIETSASMRIVVLGAGVVGTTCAWYLTKDGHEVTVVDRQSAAGLETSFANGGQVAVSHAEPWANPGAIGKIVRWLGRDEAPLRFRAHWDAAQWRWALRFLFECLPARTARNTERILALALFSLQALRGLREEARIEYDQAATGILSFFGDMQAFERARHGLSLFERLGVEAQVRSVAECVAIEPAFEESKVPIVGGIHTPLDESGDARRFTQALAELAARRGVEFRYNTLVEQLVVAGDRIERVKVRTDEGAADALRADAYVIALGSYSPLLLRAIGVRIPVYPAKGYSITLPLQAGSVAPRVALNDEAYKLVFSRLGERLRVAGTAELDGYNTELDERRCAAIVRRTFELFPRAGDPQQAQLWTGLRPATPSNVPLIGRRGLSNLYLNTGHGTLGWTLACGSGAALARLVVGERPNVEFPFLGT